MFFIVVTFFNSEFQIKNRKHKIKVDKCIYFIPLAILKNNINFWNQMPITFLLAICTSNTEKRNLAIEFEVTWKQFKNLKNQTAKNINLSMKTSLKKKTNEKHPT